MVSEVAPIRVVIQGKVSWRAFMDDATGTWIAVCDPMKLTARGDTWSDMADDCNDIIQNVLTDLLHEGELDTFLSKQGWRRMTAVPVMPHTPVHFDLPVIVEQEPERPRASA